MHRVTVARIDPQASPAVLVATRLAGEFDGTRCTVLTTQADVIVLGFDGDEPDVRDRLRTLLTEKRFHGWQLTES